jgi:hypothetical protein
MDREARLLTEEIVRFCNAAWVDFPLAAAARMLGGSNEEFQAAGWRAYDSWISMANEATNQLYTNRIFSDFSAFWFETTLRFQYMAGLLSGAAITPAPGKAETSPSQDTRSIPATSAKVRLLVRSVRRSTRVEHLSAAAPIQKREPDRAANV